MPTNLYSREEDDFLRANYMEMSNGVLAQKLGRSQRSVEKRLLSVLDLKRTQADMGRIRRKEEEMRNRSNREKHRGLVPEDWFKLPASFGAGEQAGSDKIFTGKPCINGHIALRFTQHKSCIQCQNEASERISATPERREWRREYRRRDDVRDSENRQRRVRMKDPTFKYRVNMSARISKAMRASKIDKPTESEKLIGISWSRFREWIDSQLAEGMTAENYGEWHLDHVRPCASFDLAEEAQCYVAFNWRNYQPLWGEENLNKNDAYGPADEQAWMKRMRLLGFEGDLYPVFLTEG